MSRLAFGGAEWKSATPEALTAAGTVSIDATGPRSGVACYDFASGAASDLFYALSAVATHSYYGRAWIYFSGNPAVDTPVAAWGSGSNYQEVVTLTTAGKFKGTDGSTLTSTLTPGWHCVEIKLTFTSTSSWSSEARINGTVLNTRGSHNPSLTPDRFTFGNYSGVAHAITLRADDWAVNDDNGAAQNSYPGINEKILLSLPSSDNAVGADWKLGAGTTPSANAFQAVNNVPPVGVTNASGTDGVQIRDAVASLTAPASDADFNAQSYTTAGVPSGSTITASQVIGAVALSAGGTGRSIAVRCVSNPADGAEVSTTANLSANTYPTGWQAARGNITSAPTVTLGTQPVIRVGKRNTSGTLDLCCALGLQFGYEPPTTTTFERSAAIGATAAVVAASQRDILRSTAIVATTATAIAGQRDLLRQAALAATAGVATVGQRDLLRSAVVAASTAVLVAGQRDLLRTASLAATGDVQAAAHRELLRAAALAATGDIAAAAEFFRLIERAVALAATGDIGVAAQRDLLRQAALIAIADVSVSGERAARQLGDESYTDAVVGILTVAPVTGIFTSPANRN